MASTIKIKNGTGGASPSALSQGELAINIDNGLMYFGSSSNAVRSLDTFLNVTASVSGGIGGNISASGDITANNLNIDTAITLGDMSFSAASDENIIGVLKEVRFDGLIAGAPTFEA